LFEILFVGAPGPVCRILPPPDNLKAEQEMIASVREKVKALPQRKYFSLIKSPWQWLKDKLENTFNNHVPIGKRTKRKDGKNNKG
jgi:hypothetical protein